MEIFLLLAVLFILILIFRNISGLKEELTKLQNDLFDVKNLVSRKSQQDLQKLDEKSMQSIV